jgi:hypothetical protein
MLSDNIILFNLLTVTLNVGGIGSNNPCHITIFLFVIPSFVSRKAKKILSGTFPLQFNPAEKGQTTTRVPPGGATSEPITREMDV